jgi:hypothetical protein
MAGFVSVIRILFGRWGDYSAPVPCPGEVASGRCTINPFTGRCTINPFTGRVSFSNLSGEVTLK